MKSRYLILTAVLTAGVVAAVPAWAQHDHSASHMGHMGQHEGAKMAEARHGGQMTMAAGHQIEAVFTSQGVRVYVYGEDGVPQPADELSGTATVAGQTVKLAPHAADPDTPTAYYCPMHPAATQMQPGTCDACGGMKLIPQNYLAGAADLPASTHGTAEITVKGLAGAKSPVTVEMPVMMAASGH